MTLTAQDADHVNGTTTRSPIRSPQRNPVRALRLDRDSPSRGNWSTHNFYHADGIGNITYLVNSSQTLAAAYRYDPFGNTISSSGTLASANVYRFSSKEMNVNSGLYYYGYRWYAPSLQRWVNRDPLDEVGLETALRKRRCYLRRPAKIVEGPNLYAYVKNAPLDYVDTDGREKYKLPPPGKPRLPLPIEPPAPKPGPIKKFWKWCYAPMNAVTCTSCAAGLLGIEAICGGAAGGGWQGMEYPDLNSCVCDFYNDNWLLKATCNECFSLPFKPGTGDLIQKVIGCGN